MQDYQFKLECMKIQSQGKNLVHRTLINSALLRGSIPATPCIIFSAETSICIGTSNPAKATSRLHCKKIIPQKKERKKRLT